MSVLSKTLHCAVQARKEHKRSCDVSASQLFIPCRSNTHQPHTCCSRCQWYVPTSTAMLSFELEALLIVGLNKVKLFLSKFKHLHILSWRQVQLGNIYLLVHMLLSHERYVFFVVIFCFCFPLPPIPMFLSFFSSLHCSLIFPH